MQDGLIHKLINSVTDDTWIEKTTKLFMALFFVLFCAFFYQYIQNVLKEKGRGWATERARHLLDLSKWNQSLVRIMRRRGVKPQPSEDAIARELAYYYFWFAVCGIGFLINGIILILQ